MGTLDGSLSSSRANLSFPIVQWRLCPRCPRSRIVLYLVRQCRHVHGSESYLRCNLALGEWIDRLPTAVEPVLMTAFLKQGEDRQLLPWERPAAPLVMSSSLVSIPSSPTASSTGWDEESSYGGDEKSPDSSYRTQTSATPYPWEKQDAAYDSVAAASTTDGSSRPPSYYSKKVDTISLVPTSAVSAY